MKPPPFVYHDPRTTEDAVRLLGELDDAKVLAGGQSLMPMLNFRLTYPEHLVDVNRVAGLSDLEVRADEGLLRVGATARQRTVELDEQVAAAFPLLPEAIGHIGHFQTRNRGTIGGSLAHLDPAAELATVADAAEATVHAASTDGVRTIPFAEFPAGYLTTCLRPDELVVAVDFPLWPPGHGFAFAEFARRHGDFALVAVAALLELDERRLVRRCRLSLAGLGTGPVRLSGAEELLTGGAVDETTLTAAADAARALPARTDMQAPGEYRRQLAAVLVRRALTVAHERAATAQRSRP